MIITSTNNETIKNIKKLNDKKYRDINKEYLIEGIKIIEEAILEKSKIKKIIICDECKKTEEISKNLMYEIAKFSCIYVTEKVFNSITTVTNPHGIMAIIEKGCEEEIKFNEVRVIGPDGNMLGVMAPSEAMKIADENELDLVLIAPTANPPVCKVMDYGKYKFEEMKKDSANLEGN